MNRYFRYCLQKSILLSVATKVTAIAILLGFQLVFAQQPKPGRNLAFEPEFIDRIHQGDIIDIHIAGYLEFDWRGTLTPEGFLDGYERIPKQVFARCKTESELGKELDGILSEILREPRAEVKIVDRSKRSFAIIDGAVKNPQRMQMRRAAHLNEIIVSAGGLTDRASGKIIISRPSGPSCIARNQTERTERRDIDLSDLLAGKESANPLIVSGDLIVVIEASPVFLLGAVQSEGRIDYRFDLSVSRAIDAAGGLLKDAVPRQVRIFRRDGGSTVLSVDIEKVRTKQADDVTLRPFDIIDVPFKGRPARRLPPIVESEADGVERREKLPIRIIE